MLHPCRMWTVPRMGLKTQTVAILHNMVVEPRRDGFLSRSRSIQYGAGGAGGAGVADGVSGGGVDAADGAGVGGAPARGGGGGAAGVGTADGVRNAVLGAGAAEGAGAGGGLAGGGGEAAVGVGAEEEVGGVAVLGTTTLVRRLAEVTS